MKKENENIQLHIINEDYKAKENEEKTNFSISGKAILISELENDASVIKQLNKMHEDFAETKESDCPDVDEPLKGKELFGLKEATSSLDISKLVSSFEKLKSEERALIDSKQEYLATEKCLLVELNQEIQRKKKSIEDLRGEISVLQITCGEIAQELGLPTT